MFRADQRHGATQTHFPPRPRNSQWHCNIRNVIWPHGLPIHYKRLARNVLQSHVSVSRETPSKSHASRLQDERFVQDFLQKSRVKSPKRAFRDFLQKSHVKSPKRAFRTRLPPKVKRKHPSEHTHHAALPSSFATPAPPNNTRTHANPNVTATFTSTTTHNLTIPAPATNLSASTRLTSTKYCACHEMSPPSHLATSRFPRKSHFHTSKPAQSTAPATKVTISSLVSFNKICTTPHVWNDFDPF